MKICLLFTLFTLLSIATFCQTTLEFSQVKLVTSFETVPPNTVWKIESVMHNFEMYTTSATSSTAYASSIVVNGNSVYINARSYRFHGSTSTSVSTTKTSDQSFGQLTEMPIWLPAGTTLDVGTYIYGMSVIEFNVIP